MWRRPTDQQIAIPALIAFTFWIFVALPIYYGPSDDTAAHKCSAKESENHGFWEKARCDPVAYFTLWLVGFTGVLAVSTIGLWGVTWVGIRNQSRETRILQRAYLAVEPGGVVPYLDATGGLVDKGKAVVAHIGISNAGNLPARNVSFIINTEFSPNAVWSEERLTKRSIPTIGPAGNNVVQPGTRMNQGGPTQSLCETGFVYVWGEVTYHDGFEAGRRTKFCHRYNCKRIVRDPHQGSPWLKPKYGRHYERGNDAT